MKKFVMILGITLFTILTVVVFSGCIEQFWPTNQVSQTTVRYLNEDPNDYKFPLTWLGKVENLQQQVNETHLEYQLRLKSWLDIDDGRYGLVNNELNINIQKAKEQYATWIGTLEKPGVLWTLLSGSIGAGGMATVLRRIWYTKAEVDDIVKNGKTI